MNYNTEILAPAGSKDSLTAAVRCGADAVYLGVGKFNARRNAENFGVRELKDAISYCHVRGVRVYITLNTLILDTEIPAVLELIKCGCAFGADAFIIQDPGIARIVKEFAPTMPIHASTQMAVSTEKGFNKLKELGFSQAVIPRELSFEEIRSIRENTSIDLEMFIHGALCMCVSGQCYLSGILGGRSGNRGLCAQPCRLAFSAPHGTGHDLSLKDLSLIDNIPALSELGIKSFKIEGRMKRPEYVAAAVTACKNARDGKDDSALKSDLKAIFSRSGFTDGYYTGKHGESMFGTRGKDDVTAAAPVLHKLSLLYEKEEQTIPISISLKAELHKPLMASASTGKVRVLVTSDYKVQRAINHATEVSTIRTQLKKTGGTPFSVKMTDIDIDEDINIPVSEINNIRRGVLDALEKKLCEPYVKPFGENVKDFYPEKLIPHTVYENTTDTSINMVARFQHVNQIPDNFYEITKSLAKHKITSFIVPVTTPEDRFSSLKKMGIPFGVEIPRSLYGNQKKLEKAIKVAKEHGASFAYAGTIDGILLAQKYSFSVMGASTLNIFNSFSLEEYRENFKLHSAIVSTELELKSIADLRGTLPRGILAYGRTAVMLTRNCPIKNGMDCKTCKGEQSLTDRKGIKFPVRCNNGCSEILNSRPIYLADKLSEVKNIDFLLLNFAVESKEKVKKIIHSYDAELPPTGEFTRGLYFKGVE